MADYIFLPMTEAVSVTSSDVYNDGLFVTTVNGITPNRNYYIAAVISNVKFGAYRNGGNLYCVVAAKTQDTVFTKSMSYPVGGNYNNQTVYDDPENIVSYNDFNYGLIYGHYLATGINPDFLTVFDSLSEVINAMDDGNWSGSVTTYPITYSSTNSTVSGPTEAAVGDTVTVSAVPDVDYGITDQSSQIAVTCNDEPVAFTWDATNQRITFTMPDPT